MFTKLPNNTGIYGLSAANPTESSWGCYCSPDDVVGGKHIRSCLGDLFSVNFVEDTEKGNYDQTLATQFETIKRLTAKSHVMQWGDLSFNNDKIGDFLTSGKGASSNLRFIQPIRRIGTKKAKESVMDSRTMKLQSLSAIYALERSSETMTEMMEEISSMKMFEGIFKKFSETLKVSGAYDAHNINFDCLKTSVDGFEAKCGKFTDFGLGFIKYLAHACETIPSETVLNAIHC
jgi:legumain